MADFETALKLRLVIEGGYSDDFNDNGNWTGGKKGAGIMIGSKYGISAPVLCKFLGRVATKQEMMDLTTDTAGKIYKPEYWDVMRGDEINSQEEANAIFNECVNAGDHTGIILTQREFGYPETGKMDDHTLNTLNNKS